MPSAPHSKRSSSKPSPYPPRKPTSDLTLGPSSSLPTGKKHKHKKRNSSFGGQSISTAVVNQAVENAMASGSTSAPPASARTPSAASAATADSVATTSTANSGKAKKRSDSRQKRQKKKRLSLMEVPLDAPVAGPSTKAEEPMDEDDPAAVMAYPQPDAKPVETAENIVARLMPQTKTKKRKAGPAPEVVQPIAAASPSPAKKSLAVKDGRLAVLRKELEDAKSAAEVERAEWEKNMKEMRKRLETTEGKLEAQAIGNKEAIEQKEKELVKNVGILDTLREAATCGVCLDYFKDPHILTCGHIACKACLVSWFRTPVAFLHEIPDLIHETIPTTRDVSYRTKLCHVCRVQILRRPSRMYHFDSILEPLGINPQLPTLSQDARESSDPWHNLFPPELNTYRVRDEDDQMDRCPECHNELVDNFCEECDIEFSESEGEGEMLSEGSEIGDELGDGDETGDGADASDLDGIADGDVLGMDGDELDDEAILRARRENAADARADREIRAQERQLIAERNHMFDLEAGSDGEGEEEEEVEIGAERYEVNSEEDSDEEGSDMAEIVAVHHHSFRNRDLYSPDDPNHYESGDESGSYEASFIDDDEEEEEEEDEEAEADESGITGGGRDDSGSPSGSVEVAEEDLDMEQMRQRRVARFAERVRSPSPAIRAAPSSSRRRIIVSGSDDED